MGLTVVPGGSDPGGAPSLAIVDPWRSGAAPDGLSAADERRYAARRLQEQVAAAATLLLTPAHAPGGPDSEARKLDLRLARAAVAAAHALGLDARGFPVYAALLAAPATLANPLDRAMLVRLYSDLEVGGYLVRIPGLSE